MKLSTLKRYLNTIPDGNVEVMFSNGQGKDNIVSLDCSEDRKILFLCGHNYSENGNDFDVANIISTIMKMSKKNDE